METATADPLVGHVLEGRYRITQRLARGGMSTVYSAVDQRLDRQVAVKVMASTLSSDPVFVDRFAREARVAAKLSHVNAVSVYDQGADAGKVFLVMELVRGRTLRDLLDERGHVSPAEAVSIMEPVLAALAAAHRAGLVHRDVKPENILLADDGVVKVADFGLARAIAADASSTRTGLMMGTVAYSSPEQFRRADSDARSDVYSAGIVLFELLTGQPPYRGDAMSVAYQHVHEDVPAPSTLRRGLAAPIDRLVTAATARDPARRPADAGELLADLNDLRRELHLPVLPVPRRPRQPRAGASQPSAGRRAAARTTERTDALAVSSDSARAPRTAHDTVVQPGGGRAPAGPAQTKPTRARREPIPKNRTAPKRRRRAMRTLIGALVLILVCASVGYAGWWFASGRYGSIPNVRNQPTSTATAMLKAAGFTVRSNAEAFDEDVVKGSVVRTDPSSGERLPKGRTVHLVVSEGPHFYAVPDLAGKTRAAAQQALATLVQAGVSVSYAASADDSMPVGEVIRTDPAAAAQIRGGSALSVFISTGPALLVVPDVRGKTQSDASDQLSAMGFAVSAATGFSETVPAGRVISQTPIGGAKLTKFKTVSLVVSKGPDVVAVPSIPRLESVSKARDTLTGLGFVVEVRKTFGGFSGLVVGTNPAAGTKLKRGSTVVLYVI